MQLKLFTGDEAVIPFPAASHRSDPSTSMLAECRHTVSGKRGAHARMVLDMARRMPGLTAVELWEKASPNEKAELKEMQEVRRRLYDLRSAGEVRYGPKRTCEIRGSLQVTWIPNGGAD